MSILFSPGRIGKIELKNRFVHSATFESMAASNGEVTDKLIHRYRRIAKGGVSLIIPGYCFVMANGRAANLQTGIHSDQMVDSLKKLVDTVHAEDAKIAFQLVHAGRQTNRTVIGQNPIAPSRGQVDKIYMARPTEMDKEKIHRVIKAFGSAAKRAADAGADGVQIHAAHGYLINQFLSPFFNRRKDGWGGSDERQFRFLKQIVLEVKNCIPADMAVMVKLNTNDYTPQTGIDAQLAQKYARWLAEIPIDALEVSCGTLSFSMFNMVRGEVPTKEMISGFPWWRKILGGLMLKGLEGKYDLVEGYNLEAAELIKPTIKDLPLMVVGGLRKVSQMETIIEKLSNQPPISRINTGYHAPWNSQITIFRVVLIKISTRCKMPPCLKPT